MSEPRKNHLAIDGGQVKEDDHVASYKAIPEADSGTLILFHVLITLKNLYKINFFYKI